MEFADAAARNEEVFREVNERIDEGAERHHVEGPLPFHCECCDASCVEKLPISAREYKRVVEQRFWFVALPGHETTAVERVVERHPEYFVVEEVGQAREQLERDHPQQRHQHPSSESLNTAVDHCPTRVALASSHPAGVVGHGGAASPAGVFGLCRTPEDLRERLMFCPSPADRTCVVALRFSCLAVACCATVVIFFSALAPRQAGHATAKSSAFLVADGWHSTEPPRKSACSHGERRPIRGGRASGRSRAGRTARTPAYDSGIARPWS